MANVNITVTLHKRWWYPAAFEVAVVALKVLPRGMSRKIVLPYMRFIVHHGMYTKVKK